MTYDDWKLRSDRDDEPPCDRECCDPREDGELMTQDEANEYLDELRESGQTNMFGAADWLREAFNIDSKSARAFLVEWMRTFADRQKSGDNVMSSDSKVTGGPDIDTLVKAWADAHGGWFAAMPEYKKLQEATLVACFTVSPSNPQAAAEAYPEIVAALQAMRDAFWGTSHNEIEDEANKLANAALAKVGR